MNTRVSWGAGIVLVATAGCGPEPTAQERGPTFEEAQLLMARGAEEARLRAASLTFEEYLATVPRADDGTFTVNGDVPIENEKLLREFFDRNVKSKRLPPASDVVEFAISSIGGLDQIWSRAEKRSLTYCVNKAAFGARYDKVVADMAAAAAVWEGVADVDFTHVPSEDAACGSTNENVVFDVRPVNAGRFLARAFFPNFARSTRRLSIHDRTFALPADDPAQLVGTLRHELGHIIGAQHEHTRPEAALCFETVEWRAITDYDPFSVMHYPHCTADGVGNAAFTLSERDKSGIACVYGPARGFTIDPGICSPQPGSGDALAPVIDPARLHTVTFADESVALDEQKFYDDLEVAGGTPFSATMEGIGAASGDPDLYVKFDGTPAPRIEFDCRPFKTDANEACTVDVPPGASVARVMVHGRAAGRYTLTLTYMSP